MRVSDFYFLKVTYPQVHRRKRENAGEIPGWIPKRKEARKSMLPGLVIYL